MKHDILLCSDLDRTFLPNGPQPESSEARRLLQRLAELAGELFPIAFLVAAAVTAFSAYSCIKMSNAYSSSGSIVI